jgi:Ca2+-binding RTX toxin-like protein
MVVAGACATALVFTGAAAAKEKVKVKHQHGTLIVTGTSGDDTIVLRLAAGDSSLVEVVGNGDVTDVKRDKFDHIVVQAGDGHDAVTVDDANGPFTDTEITTLDGEGGNDTLQGGAGAEHLVGGDDNDFVDGGGGADIADLGAGDDTFGWDPGEGSDVVNGQDGLDGLLFNGAAAAEMIEISPKPTDPARVLFHRDVANITMDLGGIERTDFNALGGVDMIIVQDLTGTDLRQVDIDLAGTLGGSAADGTFDRVMVYGTAGGDAALVTPTGAAVDLTGLHTTVHTANPDPTDVLWVDGGEGDDALSANGALLPLTLTLEGEDGDDTLVGSAGTDTLLGGEGDDLLVGKGGGDTLDGGPGNNIIVP